MRTISLPHPPKGLISLDDAITRRRSMRSYSKGLISLAEAGALLFACQGVTDRRSGGRSAPSAGATYPLEVMLVAWDVEGLPSGVYRYIPAEHAVMAIWEGDLRPALARAGLGQGSIARGAAVIAISAVYARTTGRYGSRGVRYVDIEAGHAAENLHLMAGALGLGTVVIGAFDDSEVRSVLGLEAQETPLVLMPVGRAK